MYRKVEKEENEAQTFELPFEGELSEENRWVIMSKLIPWAELEKEYAQKFSEEMGAPAKPFRMALGALIIKEKLGISDRETVEQIKENPYLQYFIGQESYSNKAPFDPSMMVHFRERIGLELANKVNQKMVKKAREEEKKNLEEESEIQNKGKVLLDATVTPADIKYPTDIDLLNQVRKETEKVIDILHKCRKERLEKKPKTYRKKARKDYLAVIKKRRISRKIRRKAVKKQLQYIKRNLKHIDNCLEKEVSLEELSYRQYRRFLIANEIYRQQEWMWSNNIDRIDNRIVSLTQPHVRPIVRGKAGVDVEFGAKISASCFDGYLFLDRISWENYNESGDLIAQVEAYKEFTGYYPESVHVDKIYRTKTNRAWCKERGIRMSGSPLGRPKKNPSQQEKKQAREDEKIRNEIEGKFGQGKRRFSLDRVMTKLSHTSETAIAISVLVMNLVALLRQVFYVQFSEEGIFSTRFIIFLYRERIFQNLKL